MMTSPTPPADDQPGSVEVSERDRQEAGKIVAYCAVTALMPDVERHQRVAELLSAYRREIEGNAPAVREALVALASFAVTAQARGTVRWIRILVERINDACAALGDDDRFRERGGFIERSPMSTEHAIATLRAAAGKERE